MEKDVKENAEETPIEIADHFSKLRAHSCYWGKHLGEKKGTNEMYEVIIKEFFQ